LDIAHLTKIGPLKKNWGKKKKKKKKKKAMSVVVVGIQFEKGEETRREEIKVPIEGQDWHQFVETIERVCGVCNVCKVTTESGGEIDEILLLRDGDRVLVHAECSAVKVVAAPAKKKTKKRKNRKKRRRKKKKNEESENNSNIASDDDEDEDDEEEDEEEEEEEENDDEEEEDDDNEKKKVENQNIACQAKLMCVELDNFKELIRAASNRQVLNENAVARRFTESLRQLVFSYGRLETLALKAGTFKAKLVPVRDAIVELAQQCKRSFAVRWLDRGEALCKQIDACTGRLNEVHVCGGASGEQHDDQDIAASSIAQDGASKLLLLLSSRFSSIRRLYDEAATTPRSSSSSSDAPAMAPPPTLSTVMARTKKQRRSTGSVGDASDDSTDDSSTSSVSSSSSSCAPPAPQQQQSFDALDQNRMRALLASMVEKYSVDGDGGHRVEHDLMCCGSLPELSKLGVKVLQSLASMTNIDAWDANKTVSSHNSPSLRLHRSNSFVFSSPLTSRKSRGTPSQKVAASRTFDRWSEIVHDLMSTGIGEVSVALDASSATQPSIKRIVEGAAALVALAHKTVRASSRGLGDSSINPLAAVAERTVDTLAAIRDGLTVLRIGETASQAIFNDALGPRRSLVASQLRKRLLSTAHAFRALAVRTLAAVNSGDGADAATSQQALEVVVNARGLAYAVRSFAVTAYTLCSVLGTSRDSEQVMLAAAAAAAAAAASSSSSVDVPATLLASAAVDGGGGDGSVVTTADWRNFWTEPGGKKGKFLWEVPEKKGADMKKASLNALVQTLTSDKVYSQDFTKAFLRTYQSFATPRLLIAKLAERFNVPPKTLPDSRVQAIRLRIVVALKHWVETQFFDFDDDTIAELRKLIARIDVTASALAKSLHELVEASLDERMKAISEPLQPPPSDLEAATSTDNSPMLLFLEMSDEEIARQLTIIAFAAFRAIEPAELLARCWDRPELEHRSPNVHACLRRARSVKQWMCSVVVSQQKPDDRLRALKKLLNIADLLRAANDFETLSCVIDALRTPAIQQCRMSLDSADAKLFQSLSAHEKLLSPASSYKTYCAVIAKRPVPALPCLRAELSLLAELDTSTPDRFDGGLINFKKLRDTCTILDTLQDLQCSPYSYPVVEPIFTFLSALPFFDEPELNALAQFRVGGASSSSSQVPPLSSSSSSSNMSSSSGSTTPR
jgi:RasGEF domain/RasGEF N-terminal motif